MPKNKFVLSFVSVLTFSFFVFTGSAKALDLRGLTVVGNTFFTRIQENVEYFFAFNTEQKVAVLERHADKRLDKAQDLIDQDKGEEVQNQIQNYTQIKEKQNNLLVEGSSGDVLGQIQERTIQQQQTMEQFKQKVDEVQKQVIVQAQEQVVNQVIQRVIEKEGSEGANEFMQKVEHVWAPGTAPGEAGSGGESGVVIKGGEMKFASGTGGGGGDAKHVTEGDESEVVTSKDAKDD